MYIPKILKTCLRDDLNCFPDTNFESVWVELSIQKKEMRFEFLILSPKTTCKDYFSKLDRSLLQSVICPYDLKPTNNDTATRMTNSSSRLIDYIITDDYESGIVADTILKTDHFATITALKSVILKSKTTEKFFDIKNFSAIAFHNFIENSDWRHCYGAVTGDMMLLEFQRIFE